MDKKTFINISREECLIVYKEMIENSEKRWASAEVLSKNKDYGSAISVAIISIEELVKAIIIVLDGRGFHFRKIKGVEIFFRNHEIRYVIAYFMFIIKILGDELMNWINKVNENPEKVRSVIKRMKDEEDFFCKKYKLYFLRKVVLIRQELSWFSKIDLFRQQGFYYDYSGTSQNPVKISENEFSQVKVRLEKVRVVGLFIISELSKNDLEIEKQLQELKAEFKEAGYYLKIEKILEKLRAKRKKPFEALKENFDNL